MNRQPILATNWYATVRKHSPRWDRVSENKLILWFDGFKTQDTQAAERDLMQLGGMVLALDYDRMCNKTYMIVREPQLQREVSNA